MRIGLIFNLAFLAFLVLPACGKRERPAPDAPPAPIAPGEFRLKVEAEGWPGRRAPVSIEGDASGVTVRFLRCADPVRALSPEPMPDEPAIAWEEVASAAADERMPRLRAGLYRVAASRDEREEEARLLVTDLLPVFASSAEEVLVLVADAMTGKAVPRARVLITGPSGVRSGAADAEGVFRTSFRAEGRLRIVVATDGRFGSTIVTPEAVEPTVARLVFDQEEYEPGGTVRFAGLLADTRRLRPVRLPERAFTVRDGNRRIFHRGEVEDGPAALFSGSFPIPAVCSPGVFELEIGDAVSSAVTVVAPEPRSSALEIRWTEGARIPGEPIGFQVRGEWPDGAPMAGRRVRYSVRNPAGEVTLEGHAALDEDGRLTTSFVAARGGDHRLEVRADLPGRETVAAGDTIHVRPAAFALTATPESRHVAQGTPVVVSVTVSPPPDPASPVPARLEAAGETLDIVLPTKVELNLPPGMHRIRVTARDAGGNPVEDECGVVVTHDLGFSGPEWSGAITLVADRLEYEPGDVARVLVFVPAALAGESMLLTGDGPELGSHKVLPGSGGSRVVSVEIPRDARADRVLVLRTVRNRRVREARTTLGVAAGGRRMQVSLSLPQGNRLQVRAADPAGRPIEGVAVLSVRGADGSAVEFRPGLRLDGEGRSEGVYLPGGGPYSVRATVFAPDGTHGSATGRFDVGKEELLVVRPPPFLVPGDRIVLPWKTEPPGRQGTSDLSVPEGRRGEISYPAGDSFSWVPRLRMIPVLPPTTPILRHLAGRVPAGRSELYIDLPESAEAVTVRMTGGVRAVLRDVVPLLFDPLDWPGRRLESELLGLEVLDRLAAFGTGDPPEEEAVARVLAGLAALDRDDGRTGLPKPDDSLAPPAPDEVEALVARRKGIGWGSAGETAAAVRALLPAIPVEDDRMASVRVRFGSALLGARELSSKLGRTFTVPPRLLAPGRAKLVFEKGGDLPVDYVVTIRERAEEPRREGPIRVTREWAKSVRDSRAPHRGETLLVALTVSAQEATERVVVSCPLPAGAGAVPGGHPLPAGVLREIHGDRVLFFVPTVGEKPVVLTQKLRVTHRGEFLFRRAAAWPVDRPEKRSESAAERVVFR